jgi:electron transfer flavoprotein alpha subunit
MAEVLVLVDHVDGKVKKVTLELLTLAQRLGEPSAVVIGAGAGGAAVDTAPLAEHGAAKVYVADAAELTEHPIAPVAEVLAHLVGQLKPVAVLLASGADGKEIAGRLAVKTDSGIITDAVDLQGGERVVAEQSVFGGSTVVHSSVTTGTAIISVRPNSVAPTAAPAAAEQVPVSITLSPTATSARITDRVVQDKGARPELTEAAIVVSGGRGVGAAERFTVIEALADSLGAAVGASRAATDAGWYPHQFQVGQTGKTVSPQLYIANGISGAIQHRAGMQTSKTIVAVNKDAEAPIFELVDFGVVGDLHVVVPQLTEEIIKRKG